jgi:hypothetical protein
MNVKLLDRTNCGKGYHRSGWPSAEAALRNVCDSSGPLVDICPEQGFLFGPDIRTEPYTMPWIGIFHFPADIISPHRPDLERNSAYTLWRNQVFQESLPSMVGGICMASALTEWWVKQTHKPFITLKHPTDTKALPWTLEKCQDAFPRRVIQLGFHLRDTRAIYRVPPQLGWRYERVRFYQQYQKERDAVIKKMVHGECNNRVDTLPRLTDAEYDLVMASSVVISKAFGVAACNVIVEAIARGTPVIVERRPETEEYLGRDYCMYWGELELTDDTFVLANEQLIARQAGWLEFTQFAKDVLSFSRQCVS